MKLIALSAACAAAISLGGCASLSKVDIPATVNALAAAGCKGTIHNTVTATTASGISPGSGSVTHDFTGDCDPSRVQHPPAAGIATPGAAVGTSPQ